MTHIQWTVDGDAVPLPTEAQRFWTKKHLWLIGLCGAEVIGVAAFLFFHATTAFVQVAISKHSRLPYAVLSADDIQFIKVPKGEWTQNLMAPGRAKYMSTHALRFGATSGQLLTESMFLSSNAETNVSSKIPPGKRLMVLGVDMAGLETVLHPGSLVDIVADLDLPDKGKVTGVIADSVTLTGIGDDIAGVGAAARSTQTVSFFVTPQEFNFFSFLKDKGHFSVALRNPNDRNKSNKPNAMTLNQFLASTPIKGIYDNDLFQIKK